MAIKIERHYNNKIEPYFTVLSSKINSKTFNEYTREMYSRALSSLNCLQSFIMSFPFGIRSAVSARICFIEI